jgi:hypothetical protein
VFEVHGENKTFNNGQGLLELDSITQIPVQMLEQWTTGSDASSDQVAYLLRESSTALQRQHYIFVFHVVLLPSHDQSFQLVSAAIGRGCCICGKKEAEGKEKLCGGCRSISYCGTEHQKLDWPQHKLFCKTMKKVLETNADIVEIYRKH